VKKLTSLGQARRVEGILPPNGPPPDERKPQGTDQLDKCCNREKKKTEKVFIEVLKRFM